MYVYAPFLSRCSIRSYLGLRRFCSQGVNQIHSTDVSQFEVERIRNFSIIAHVDHGKSTLADRILEYVGAISKSSDNKQVLDKLQVERDRGITVKAQTATFIYEHKGTEYLLNLIDTPGHVDFNNEVSKSLNACQGVVLLVDANQGIQAQTVSNFYLAFGANLAIIPVLNKIDLPHARPDLVKEQMNSMFEIPPETVILASAKTGQGISDILSAIIENVPHPDKHGLHSELKFFIQDSWYDQYKGTVNLVQIVDGILKLGDQITSVISGKSYTVKSLAILTPEEVKTNSLHPGQVGIFTANIRTANEIVIGDTYHAKDVPVTPHLVVTSPTPMVFAGFYPFDQTQYPKLRKAIEKLNLNDSSVTVMKESSGALGNGWRIGFLGLLHMEVFSQRLEQEYDASVIVTTPTVPYKIKLKESAKKRFNGKEEIYASSASEWVEKVFAESYYEPMVKGTLILPSEYMSQVQGMCQSYRGQDNGLEFIGQDRIKLEWLFPLNEIVTNFFDELKQLTSGYGSFDYEEAGYAQASLVRMDILLNGDIIDELSTVCHASKARERGKRMVQKLKESLPRQQFVIAIQAAVGKQILARENIKAYRKDVTAKCYGGDLSRKMKLLKNQAEGKKRMMKSFGNIEVPKEIFVKLLTK